VDTKINLESLLQPTGASLTGSPAAPANGNGSFAQTFLQQLQGAPDSSDAVAATETPQLPGLDSLINSLLSKLADTSFAGQSAKFGKSSPAQIGTDAQTANASTPDTSVVNPLIAALLNGVPPAQLQPIVQNAVAGNNQSAPQLGIGIAGDSANTARAAQQVLTALAQQTGMNDMTKNPKPPVSLKGLPVAAPPDMTPKPITPTDLQSASFIPPAGRDGVMTPAPTKTPDSKPMTDTQSATASSPNGKITGLPPANPTAVQPAAQNSDPKNHSETSSQSSAGQNSSDAESKKKLPDTEQFSVTAIQEPDSSHTQSGSITILSQTGPQSNGPSQHATAAPSPAPATPNVIAANDTAAPRVVHEARLMQAAGQAEMQVSMRSESAGTVSVKAILEGSHLSATVSAPSVETRDWLVNNLHELYAGLSRDDLSLRSFQVSDPGLQGGWNGQDTRQQESQEQYRPSAYSGGRQGSAEETISGADSNSLDLNETASRALSLHA